MGGQKRENLHVRISPELKVQLDEARGDVSAQRYVTRVLEREMERRARHLEHEKELAERPPTRCPGCGELRSPLFQAEPLKGTDVVGGYFPLDPIGVRRPGKCYVCRHEVEGKYPEIPEAGGSE